MRMHEYANGIEIAANEKHNQSHENQSQIASGGREWPHGLQVASGVAGGLRGRE
jgi:hypothetical protein